MACSDSFFPTSHSSAQSPLIWSLSYFISILSCQVLCECHAWASQLIPAKAQSTSTNWWHIYQDIEVSEAQAGPLTVVFSDVKNTRKHCSTQPCGSHFQSHKWVGSSSPSGLLFVIFPLPETTMHQLFT